MVHVALALILASPLLLDEEEILHPGTGPHTRPVVIAEGKARLFFNQGLNFLYAFNHDEARSSFRTAAKYDPNSGMAWWGLAMANGPHINRMSVSPAEELDAVRAIDRAMANIDSARPVDQALIRAIRARFANPQPADRGPLNKAFAEAMRKVWRQFPRDDDVGALFAESLMDLRPWGLWTVDGKPHPGTEEIVSILERVMALNPKNPMGLHLYIHAVETSPKPERALRAANLLRGLQPGLGHNVHMPTHIDARLGRWQEAIDSNLKAIEADHAYRARRPQQQVQYRHYMLHNHHMLAFACMMLGRGDMAIRAVDEMLEEVPFEVQRENAGVFDGYQAMPFEVRKRFGKWDEILALPVPPEHFPLAIAMRHAARSVAYSAKKMTSEARREQALFDATRQKVPSGTYRRNSYAQILQVADDLSTGEVLLAEGRTSEAVEVLRKGVEAEDGLGYSEPPAWIQPVRHTLGALLTKLGRHEEAVAVYREDLKRLPNNGWSTYGLSASLRALGKTAEADKMLAKFKSLWAEADIEISSSCLCIPGEAKGKK